MVLQFSINYLVIAMFPIGIEIELTASYIDSDLEDLICDRSIIYEKQLRPKRKRKIAPLTMQEHLDSRVPGRHKEIQLIEKYVSSVMKGEKSPLCLHGSTGCGKTSIVTELMKYLRNQNPDTQVLYLNCLTFTSIRRIYSTILEQFFDKKDKKPDQALSTLFTAVPQLGDNTAFKLLILDQIDQVFSSKSFIYNILQWCTSAAMPFGLILISNMVDFASKIQSKCKSRIKFNSIIFAPYSYEELIEIVKHKYGHQCDDIFEDDAIVYLCKKVAGINSDVRLIQKYYQDAKKQFHKNKDNVVTLADIQSMFVVSNKQVDCILEPYRFILEILWRSPRRKNISQDIQHYCLGKALKKFTESQVLYYLVNLQSMGVLKLNKGAKFCDYYYNSWGINLEEYAFVLEINRSQI